MTNTFACGKVDRFQSGENMTSEKAIAERLKPGELTVVPRPVVYLPEGRVQAFYAVPMKRTSDGEVLIGHDLLAQGVAGERLDHGLLAANARRILNGAALKAKDMVLTGVMAPMIVPLNALALGLTEIASEFTETCREIDDDVRANFVFEVGNFPKKLPLSLIDDLAILMYPFCRYYLARPNVGQLDLKVFANTNFQGVALDFRDKPWPIGKAKPAIEKFFASAQRQRLSTYLHGVGSKEILEAAMACPFDFADGLAAGEGRPLKADDTVDLDA